MWRQVALAVTVLALGVATVQAQEIPNRYKLVAFTGDGTGDIEFSMSLELNFGDTSGDAGGISGRAIPIPALGRESIPVTGSWRRCGDDGEMLVSLLLGEEMPDNTTHAVGLLIPTGIGFAIRGHWFFSGWLPSDGAFDAQNIR